MNTYRINQSYAKALYTLATETGVAERVDQDMRLIGEVCAENRQLTVVFANPTVPVDRKLSIVDALFGPHASDTTMAFLHFVVRKNRSVHLHGICQAYVDMHRKASGIVLGDLVTHQPADEKVRQRAIQLVQQYTGKQVELHDHTDPNMLGGYKLQFDGKMYDARLRTKIRKLRIAFSENEYESKL